MRASRLAAKQAIWLKSERFRHLFHHSLSVCMLHVSVHEARVESRACIRISATFLQHLALISNADWPHYLAPYSLIMQYCAFPVLKPQTIWTGTQTAA